MAFASVPGLGQAALDDQAPTNDPFLEFAYSENGNALSADQDPMLPTPVNYTFLADSALLRPGQDSFPDLALDMNAVDGGLTSTYSPYLGQTGFSAGVATPEPYLSFTQQPSSSDPDPASLRVLNSPPRPSNSKRANYSGKLSENSLMNSRETSAVSSSTNTAKRGRKPKSKEPSSDPEALMLKAKATHSEIERRYRDNLKDKILQLHDTLLAIGANPRMTRRRATGSSPPSTLGDRVRKAEVFTNAINYIHQSEVEIRHMANEIQQLRTQLYQLEQLAGSQQHLFRNLAM
ncbi:uncharacterized protein PV07_03661 [Cladophialophora immunda]|uniref:BHLH domain-containing protein n=1 Tax=Cladophialophora immunda TaxID=569365 RepID=A0A0D2D8S1_9EURO|nr:uncharacterized protein PV07_03661 [Cladophialophora immunda]KIW32089.1 hypothetical protein PV07_03661 [Cladophialophora immunda]OQU96799.1 Helix-loop-helix DNA-binding domain-containing protein [Cladophialophora immunda]